MTTFVTAFYFFFSSRRRHTRCSRDWSSDVCSSDLHVLAKHYSRARWRPSRCSSPPRPAKRTQAVTSFSECLKVIFLPMQIGRASCRERVLILEDELSLKNNNLFIIVLNIEIL